MPPSKKKPSPKKATAKKPAAKKSAASAKRVTRKPRTAKTKDGVPALPPSSIPTDEQGFLAALKKAPDDRTVHLAYAEWLAKRGHPSRAAAVRAWVELVRVPLAAGIAQVRIAYQHYRE